MLKIQIAMILLLLLLFMQDLNHRRVSTLIMLGLSILSAILSMKILSRPEWTETVIMNSGVVISLLVFSVMTQLIVRRIAGIGLGDVWMLLICVPAMSPSLLLPFLLTSFLLSLILFLLLKGSGKSWESIPLAGIISLCLAILIGADLLFEFNRYSFTPLTTQLSDFYVYVANS
jgi:uncharacterized membrane protein YhaH (DUF805 family)